MQKLFVCLLAVLWCEYAYGYEERFVKDLIKVHSHARSSFKYQGDKLPPLKYSRKLMNLAREWVNACRESRPTDRRFANLGSSVITAGLYLPLVSQWKSRLSIEAKAYNPATGQCIDSPCEHYRQVCSRYLGLELFKSHVFFHAVIPFTDSAIKYYGIRLRIQTVLLLAA
ncbi:Glioma pathogenesis-related protein 1 [Taenia solium]|eukprot:TsM_000633900 transcript=TsM_000633900 gene=TsM_000633900